MRKPWGTEPDPRDPGDDGLIDGAAPDLVELAYIEAVRALEDQSVALEKLRGRSATFSTGLVAVAALVLGLEGLPTNRGWLWLLALSGACAIASFMFGVLVQLPSHMDFGKSADVMLSDPNWHDSPSPKADLAFWLGRDRRGNENRLTIKSDHFAAQLVLGVLSIVAFAGFVLGITGGGA